MARCPGKERSDECEYLEENGVDRANGIIIQTQTFDGAGGKVLHHDVGPARHVLDQRNTSGILQVYPNRFLGSIK